MHNEVVMTLRRLVVSLLVVLAVGAGARGQDAPAAAAGDLNPLLCLEAGGPTAAVTALAFSPDGRALFAAGYDKVVRVWRRAANAPRFELDAAATFRVPIGPGRSGVINVLAVSPDGKWLAASGLGVYRGASSFGQRGWIIPEDALDADLLRDRHVIYLFNTETRSVGLLRGHEEDVLAVAFAPRAADAPQLLVSVGRGEVAKGGASTGRVCVWDVGRAAVVNDRGELADRGPKLHEALVPNVPKEPPGLSVRAAPEGRPRVAVAWGDGTLRVWEVGPGGMTLFAAEEASSEFGKPQMTYALGSVPGGFLTGGGSLDRGGYLQVWQDAASEAPKPGRRVQLQPATTLPRSIHLVASAADGQPDHSAVVLRADAGPGRSHYYLGLLRLRDYSLISRPGPSTSLGVRDVPPIVAASPDGQFLAVTTRRNLEVQVFAARDLFGPLPNPTPLRGAGGIPGSVAFVRKTGAAGLGLFLSRAPAAPPGRPIAITADDLVFDVTKPGLTADPVRQGWRLASPAESGWQAAWIAADPIRFQWSGPGAPPRDVRLRLRPSQAVTSWALLPPLRPSTVPVLAVAAWDRAIGEPQLALYDAVTGQRIRELTAHVQPILSLAASPDGRLLASAADDQTVCIWSLTDLPRVLGQQATLSGLSLRRQEDSLVVTGVEPGTPAAAALAAGDVIDSLTVGGPDARPRRVRTPFEFYDALWGGKPGGTVSLQVRRGAEGRVARVVLEQGVDDSKPLFSLFVTADRAPEWIAWTPLGPYDASSREAERYLGWHFNPKQLGGPVRFAPADAYREQQHKPGLLKPLLARGNLADALGELVEKPIPRASILWAVESDGPEPAGGGDGESAVLVRAPRVTLKLRVAGPSLDRNEVEAVTWRVNDRPQQQIPLEGAAGDLLTQAVELGARGVHRIQVRLRTREKNPQEVVQDIVVRYQPPAPRIRLEGLPDARVVVREGAFRLRASVAQDVTGQAVAVTLQKNKEAAKSVGRQVDEQLRLEPGENVLELRAVNEGALNTYEAFETERRTIVVVFQQKDAPNIELTSVVPVAPSGAPVPVHPGQPATVAARQVRVRGRIVATEKLAEAKLGNTPLSGFKPDTAVTFEFDQPVTLAPGSQELVIVSRSANSVEAKTAASVVYRPLLPALTLTDPDAGRELIEGRDERVVTASGYFTRPAGLPEADLAPFEVGLRVFHDGRAVTQDGGDEVVVPSAKLAAPDRDGRAGGLSAALRLEPGDNRIEVVVRNKWQTAPAVERHVSYRRPPRVVSVAAPPPGDQPLTDIVAEVESKSELTRVEGNGQEYPVAEVAARVGPAAGTTWRVTLPRVPLSPGPNDIRLVVSNADGPCLAEGRATVEFKPPKPKLPPRIEVANRPRGAVIDQNFAAQFVVRSPDSRVRRVELRAGSRVVAAVDAPEATADDPAVFKGALGPVPLADGSNQFQLVAINDGGPATESLTVSHVPVPARLELDIDRLPRPVPEAEFVLTGRVIFTDAINAAEVRRKLSQLRVYVNQGFMQEKPFRIRSAGPNRQEFDVRVVLNQAKGNVIEVVCPDLHPDAGGRQQFVVDCARPRETPRNLHVLIVAVDAVRGANPAKDLAHRALKALNANADGSRLRSTVFQRVIMHPYVEGQPTQMLSEYVTKDNVLRAVESIRKNSSPNDVALIYWLGREAYENGEQYLLTSDTRPNRPLAQSALPVRQLLNFPGEVPGARALLLDVANSGAPDTPAPWRLASTRAAVLRYPWARKDEPLDGLLVTLEAAAAAGGPISLQTLATTAARSREKFPGSPTLDQNLREVPNLANLVLSQGR